MIPESAFGHCFGVGTVAHGLGFLHFVRLYSSGHDGPKTSASGQSFYFMQAPTCGIKAIHYYIVNAGSHAGTSSNTPVFLIMTSNALSKLLSRSMDDDAFE